MKYLTAIFFVLFLPVSAQDSLHSGSAFCEAGIGYSLNFESATWYDMDEDAFVGTPYSIHGVIPSLHFGVLFSRYGHLGLAARFCHAVYPVGQKRIMKYYTSQYPDLFITVDQGFAYRLNLLEAGALFSIPKRRWRFDGEFLIGTGKLTYPYLFVTGVRPSDPGEYALLVSRGPWRMQCDNVSIMLGGRNNFDEKHYLFFRTDLTISFPDITIMMYERYPSHPLYDGSVFTSPSHFFNFSAGYGIRIP